LGVGRAYLRLAFVEEASNRAICFNCRHPRYPELPPDRFPQPVRGNRLSWGNLEVCESLAQKGRARRGLAKSFVAGFSQRLDRVMHIARDQDAAGPRFPLYACGDVHAIAVEVIAIDDQVDRLGCTS
jgi:hypothetical protein